MKDQARVNIKLSTLTLNSRISHRIGEKKSRSELLQSQWTNPWLLLLVRCQCQGSHRLWIVRALLNCWINQTRSCCTCEGSQWLSRTWNKTSNLLISSKSESHHAQSLWAKLLMRQNTGTVGLCFSMVWPANHAHNYEHAMKCWKKAQNFLFI